MSAIPRKHSRRSISLKKQGRAVLAHIEASRGRRFTNMKMFIGDKIAFDQTPRPGKGLKGGLCNRTACQDDLTGSSNWSMHDYGTTDGRLYYCDRCAYDFTDWDTRSGDPIRCSIIEGDER